jgi:hypothetical protein
MSDGRAADGDGGERLLAELRRLAGEVDPVPDEVSAYGKAALGWRRIDAELAELLSDSRLEPASAAATRSGLARARSVTFRAGDLEIALEIHDADSGLRLLGQLAPPGPAAVEVQRDDSAIVATSEADALGRFRIDLGEGGRIRLLVRRPAPARLVETSWLDA